MLILQKTFAISCKLHGSSAEILEPVSLLNRRGHLRNGYWTGGLDDFPRIFTI